MVRIPQLPEQSTGNLSASDYFPVYDAESDSTKKLSWPNLIIALGSSFGSSIAGTVTGSKVVVSTGTNTIGESSVTTTELAYLSGVTSGIQAQINGLAAGNVSAAPLLAPTADVRNVIQPGNATSPNLILKLAASQTARPLRLESSSGTLLLSAGTNGQLISNVPTGTAPLSVDSTTLVANLNVERLGGYQAADFVLLASTTAFAAASHTHVLSAIAGGTASGANSQYAFTRTGGTGSSATVDISAGSAGPVLILRNNASTEVGSITEVGEFAGVRFRATGSAPTVPFNANGNTTKCTNLNADTVDGYDLDTGYSAGVILAGTGAGGALGKVPAGTVGQTLTYTTGGALVPATPASGGASTTQRVLFQLPADLWRGVTANRPEPTIAGTTGWSSGTYALAFDSSTVETAQRECGILPPDLTTSGSIGITLFGAALSATTGSAAFILSSRQHSGAGAYSGAFTDFATVSAALPAATTSGYSVGYMTTAAALGWSPGHCLSLQLRRATTGSATHAGDALFHAINVREVT